MFQLTTGTSQGKHNINYKIYITQSLNTIKYNYNKIEMLNEKHINHSYNKIPPVCKSNAEANIFLKNS
jgi:hypothetical protein